MRIFCDTNVIAELIEDRQYAGEVQLILATKETVNQFYMSGASFFTLAYLIERFGKQQDIHRPMLTDFVRKTLRGLLRIFHVTNVDEAGLEACLNDSSFSDIEDSGQYQAALACKANILLTINIKDFKLADNQKIEILTPKEFLEKYGIGKGA